MISKKAFDTNLWIVCSLIIRLNLFPKYVLTFWILNTPQILIAIDNNALMAYTKEFFKYHFHFIHMGFSLSLSQFKKKKEKKKRKNLFWFRNLTKLYQKKQIESKPTYEILGLPDNEIHWNWAGEYCRILRLALHISGLSGTKKYK